MNKLPSSFNPYNFYPGQEVLVSGRAGTIIRHYHEGMWEVRLPSGDVCVAFACIKPA